MINTHASVQLKSGSFDDQVYGKDGIVLLYDTDSEDLLYAYSNAAERYNLDDRIHFWHLNCDYTDFCEIRSEVQRLPTLLYSFRNEFWQSHDCKMYNEHAFELFFKTKINENCLNTRSLCSSVMNLTIEEYYGKKNHSSIKLLYNKYKEEGDKIEKEWNFISNEIQENFMRQRTEFQLKLRNADDKMKIFGQMMEELHLDAYDSNEEKLNEIVIDMRQ